MDTLNNGRFQPGNQAAKGRGKRRYTELFQKVINERGAVESITEELIDMFFNAKTPIKEKRQIGEFILNKLIISAEKDTELEIAQVESKSKEQLIAELLERKPLNEHLPKEGALS